MPLTHKLTKYSLVGLLGAAVFYLALWLLVGKFGVPVLYATSAAFVLVTLQNYLLHYVWTFASDHAHHTALPRFALMNVVGFGLNWGVMYLGVTQLDWNYLLVQTFAVAGVITWNFVLSNGWIFRTNTESHPSSLSH
jgi:putative flippase GtrA